MEDDVLFDLVSNAMIWQLSAPDSSRGPGTAHLHIVLAAAGPVLIHTAVRMLAVADSHRFPTFLEIAFLLANDNADNCIEMMKENIIENIFYRFNPYFPITELPTFNENPADPRDWNLKLGESCINISTTLSLLLVLLTTTKAYLERNPTHRSILPCPDAYSQRCFIWAYRYECRVRGHQNERITLTVVIGVLLYCFGDRLTLFSSLLMPDLMSLSVLTELPTRSDWIGTVNMNTGQVDVQFKSILIALCVDLIKAFPANKFMTRSSVQCIILAMVCDIARAGDAVGQIVTWRAKFSASHAVFALLHLLSDDLAYTVTLADEAFNMYKNIKISPEDEAVLVLCSHYMTLKLNEVWVETKIRSPTLLPQDQDNVEEFLNIGVGWAKEIKRQQEDVIQKDINKVYLHLCM
ncbi:unnamed protein product [Diatraea saccharalis]|uniref:Uncharacterized protein n=1 Tax=Diatraea saccharalis TaxID=40085 RepID=A0A9N9QSW5_9NEOP|nr:unnamed protein product [Diatraea saccharalis]